jgi:hypothetical protein
LRKEKLVHRPELIKLGNKKPRNCVSSEEKVHTEAKRQFRT